MKDKRSNVFYKNKANIQETKIQLETKNTNSFKLIDFLEAEKKTSNLSFSLQPDMMSFNWQVLCLPELTDSVGNPIQQQKQPCSMGHLTALTLNQQHSSSITRCLTLNLRVSFQS